MFSARRGTGFRVADEPDDFEKWLLEAAEHPDALAFHRMAELLREAKRGKKSALEQLALADERVDVALGISERRKKKLAPIKKRGKAPKSQATAVIMASDWHVEETVLPEQVNGLNEFNPAVAERRAHSQFLGSSWMVNNLTGWQIKDAVLWLGGDMISGYIHEELEETNSLSPTEAVLFAQRLIEQGIDYLLAETPLERIRVVCNYGNHGRTQKRRRVSSGAKNSFEWLMYHTLRMRYRDEPRVEFQIADGIMEYVDVYDQTIRFTHGDDIRYWGGVGGLSVPLNKAIPMWNKVKDAHITVLGHYHQFKDFGNAVVNGSLIGLNAFALSIKCEPEPPRQGFFVIDERRGKRLVSPIYVDEDGKRGG